MEGLPAERRRKRGPAILFPVSSASGGSDSSEQGMCGFGGPMQIGNDVLIACQPPPGDSERQRMGTAGLVKRDGADQGTDLMWRS